MFANCWSLESLDLSGFQTGCVQDMGCMFAGWQNLVALDLGDCDYSTISDHSRFINAVAYRSEAIYNRIHKLAFGRDWVYDFEKFVEYDLINIGQSNTMSISPKKRSHTVGGPHSSSTPFKIVEDYTKPNGKRTVTVIMN